MPATGSFEVQTAFELGQRRAHEPDAHGLAERLVDAALPRLVTGAAPQDAPHLRKTFVTAARLGAGLGLLSSAPPDVVDRRTAGALWQARRSLPGMPAQWSALASWLLLAGHWAARTDVAPHTRAIEQLTAEL